MSELSPQFSVSKTPGSPAQQPVFRKLNKLSAPARFGLAVLSVCGVAASKSTILLTLSACPTSVRSRTRESVFQELLDSKMLLQPDSSRYGAPPELSSTWPWLLQDTPEWQILCTAAQQLAMRWKAPDGESACFRHCVLARIAFYHGEPQEFLTQLNSFGKWAYVAVPALLNLAEGLHAGLLSKERQQKFGNLTQWLMALAPDDKAVEHLLHLLDEHLPPMPRTTGTAPPALRIWLNQNAAEYALAAGDFNGVEQMSFLPGNQVTAFGVGARWLSSALPRDKFLERIGKKKPKTQWNGLGSAVYVLALIAADTEEHRAEALRVAKTRKHKHSPLQALGVAEQVERYVCAHRGKSRFIRAEMSQPTPTSLATLLEAILYLWMPQGNGIAYSPDESEPITEDDICGQIAGSFRHGWLLRQWLAVLKRIAPDAAQEVHHQLPQQLKQPAEGEFPLVDLLKEKPEWEQLFEQMDRCVGNPASQGTKPATTEKRLAWTVRAFGDDWDIQARLQTRKGRAYSSGRKVALKRLYDGEYPVEPSEQDQRIIAQIERRRESTHYGYNDFIYSLDSSVLPLLVSHPAVFDERNMAPLDVCSADPQVSLVKRSGGYGLQTTPQGHASVSVVRQGQSLTVYNLTSEQQAIFELLASASDFPEQALERAHATLKRISSRVLCVDEHGAIGNVEERTAEAQVITQLTPGKDVLDVTLLVRPLGKQGPTFAPAEGPERVLAQREEKSVMACRNLKQEAKDCEALIAQCPVLQAERESGPVNATQFELVDPELMLELVSGLSKTDAAVEWPEGTPYRILPVKSAVMNIQSQSGQDWLDADIEVEVDAETKLDYATLLAAVRGNRRFVSLADGGYVELEKSLVRRIERLAAFQIDESQPEHLHPLAALSLGAVEESSEPSCPGLTVKGNAQWAERSAALKKSFSRVVRIPGTLKAQLRGYQREGVQWAIRLSRIGAGACLADDMGLGKTVQTLALLLSRANDGPALVVAPASVVGNWQKEAQRFAPSLQVQRLADMPRTTGGEANDSAHRVLPRLGKKLVLLTTYEMAYREIESLEKATWSTLVLDEAQAIKNPDARRTKAISSLSAGFKLALSGTPIENHLGELWSLFHVVNPGLLGTRTDFARRFQGPIERGDAVKLRQLQDLITPFVLRRTKAQVLKELPPRTELTLEITLSEAERKLYEASRHEALERLNGPKNQQQSPLQILAELTRLRQLCCHPKLAFPGSKLSSSKHAALMELVTELQAGGHRALIFSQFVTHLALVQKLLKTGGFEFLYLDGATKIKDREQRVEAFQAGQASFFLISLKAGGVGLNLTAADYVIHLDPWWNPAVEDQASDRVHRIGQTRPVTVYRLIAKDTIEEKLISLHEQKRDLADKILSEAGTSARLSAKDMLKMLENN